MNDDVNTSSTDEISATPSSLPPEATKSSGATRKRRRRALRHDGEGVRHTRISAAWAAVATITVLGVALIDFIVENTHSVDIHFFSANGRLPVAAALLAAALAGAAVVLAVGVCRTAQLRLSIRHRRRAGQLAANNADGQASATSGDPSA
jgi:uncharacterized integral membrane protein